jgi:catechol 2,3-dioxygenase-like lactoylglutathione lyase family enzyme
MRLSTLSTIAAVASAVVLSTAGAQTIVAEGPVVYGHHHFNTTDMAAQKRFFVETLGGTLATIGTNNLEVIEFPNVFLFFRPMQAPTGGTIGSTVNHVGFSVPDLKPVVAKLKANGFKMITTDSVAATVKVTDDIAAASPTTNIAFVLGPEEIKVELVEVKAQTAPIQLHHVHFFGEQQAEMQAWYAKVFGAAAQPANPNQAFVTAQLPGVTLSFTRSPTPTEGTQGRALDHIGFEIKNLEAFTKKLEADGIPLTVSYRRVDALNIAIAFIKDPWGTNIELTEGLSAIK